MRLPWFHRLPAPTDPVPEAPDRPALPRRHHLLLDHNSDPVAAAWVDSEGRVFLESCTSGAAVGLEQDGTIHLGEMAAGEFVSLKTLVPDFTNT